MESTSESYGVLIRCFQSQICTALMRYFQACRSNNMNSVKLIPKNHVIISLSNQKKYIFSWSFPWDLHEVLKYFYEKKLTKEKNLLLLIKLNLMESLPNSVYCLAEAKICYNVFKTPSTTGHRNTERKEIRGYRYEKNRNTNSPFPI